MYTYLSLSGVEVKLPFFFLLLSFVHPYQVIKNCAWVAMAMVMVMERLLLLLLMSGYEKEREREKATEWSWEVGLMIIIVSFLILFNCRGYCGPISYT